MSTYQFGMIGLGTMGRNLLLNVADHGFKAVGYDRDPAKGSLLESSATQGTSVKSAPTLAEMVAMLEQPRKIMMLVTAGTIVDSVINDLLPLVQPGDIIIDGGNSHFTDTLKRIDYLKEKNIHFVGMGVSGGEEGARNGPSIMPGGDVEAWQQMKPILEAISAKVNDNPCVAYMGKGAAGHYVKMVHNGIEYAIMQLISETYSFMKHRLHMSNEEMSHTFKIWNQGPLQSFLIEITSHVLNKVDDKTNGYLVDIILDKAGSKGTGKWTSQEGMELPAAIPVIDMAVAMRTLSSIKEERVQASTLYPTKKEGNKEYKKVKTLQRLHDGLTCATIICYAQGLAMLHKASVEKGMDIPLQDVVKIWRGGCIIRSALLEVFNSSFDEGKNLPNILLDESIAQMVNEYTNSLRKMVALFAKEKLPAGGHMSALAYMDSYCSATLPTNLIQAQRDYFGAHTYERIDIPGSFHTNW